MAVEECSSPPVDEQSVWQHYAGSIAWPTIGLLAAVLVSQTLVVLLSVAGLLAWWFGMLLAAVNGYLAFTVAHEACHGNIRGRHSGLAWLESAMGWIASAILFVPYSGFRAVHLLHHAHVNDPHKDPDHWVAGTNPVSVAARCLTIVGYYYYSLLCGSAATTRLGRSVRASSMLFLMLLWSVFAGLVVAGFGREALFLWLLPSLLAVGVLAFSFDWLPHHPHNVQRRYQDTRILLLPGLTLPMMWQNYHLIHHLYPRVPFYHYGRCFSELRSHLEAQGAPVEGFGAGQKKPFTPVAPSEPAS